MFLVFMAGIVIGYMVGMIFGFSPAWRRYKKHIITEYEREKIQELDAIVNNHLKSRHEHSVKNKV
jgi:hypothetical protein